MATAFIGNIMLSNISTNISAKTARGIASGNNQTLDTNILANASKGSGNYSYQWSFTGTPVTFTAATSNSTNLIYNSISAAGSTTIFCTVTDKGTGVATKTSEHVTTWPDQTIPINSVTWSINSATNSTYNGSAKSVTVVSVTPSGATYNTVTTSATNFPENASTTISGTGYYTGSFTSPVLSIVQAPASSSSASGTTVYLNYNGQSQSATVITGLTGLTITSGSASASGINAGEFPTSVTLGGNFSGTVTGKLVITQGAGSISLSSPSPIPAGNTNTISFSSYVISASSSYAFTTSAASGPGSGDANITSNSVTCTNAQTAGFSITITATINDPNYTAGSDTKTIVFSAYVAPPDPPSGGGSGGGFVSE